MSEHGNEKLTAVYNKYSDQMYRISLAQLQNSEDAADAVHDVFVRFLDSSISFIDENHEKAWFIRATVNRCKDIYRKRKIRTHLSIDEIRETVADISQADTAFEVIKSLDSLPEKNRIVITLHYLEGFSVDEISQMLSIGNSAVKMRLSRGREALKEIISREEK